MARTAALLSAVWLLSACGGAGAGSLRYELEEGRVAGAFAGDDPFWREGAPALGPELDRRAALAGLALLERQPVSQEELERLLSQGLPILIALEPGRPEAERYAVLIGHDKERDLWIIRDNHRPDRLVSGRWLRRRRAKSGQWALVAVPAGGLARELRGLSHWSLRPFLDGGPVTKD